MAVGSETMERHGFPSLAWGPVFAGVLLALACHVVLGLVGAAFGFAARPADSTGLSVLAGFWALVTPFVATLLGAWLACRLAERRDEAGSNLQSVMVWAIGLVAGALFLAGTALSGAMSAGTAASGNAGLLQRGAQQSMGAADVNGPRAQGAVDEAAKRAATAAAGGAMAALCGLAGAFAGAAVARARREGKGRGLGWRIALQRTDRQAERRADERRPQERPYPSYPERTYPRPEGDARDVAPDDGPGTPGDPYRH